MPTYSMRRLQEVANKAALRSSDPTRHKCFVSYHEADTDEVEGFLDSFGDIFIARIIGVSPEDPFIDSDDDDYIKRRIRELYLADSTVTIVLIGKCTWSRRFVDWELASTLRNDTKNKRSGLVGITLPSIASYSDREPPARLSDNLPSNGTDGYARWKKYPNKKSDLRSWIHDAFTARDTRSHLVDNSRALRQRNGSC